MSVNVFRLWFEWRISVEGFVFGNSLIFILLYFSRFSRRLRDLEVGDYVLVAWV